MKIEEMSEPIFCEHCGLLLDQFILIDELWCLCCANNDGTISDEQFADKQLKNWCLYHSWLLNEASKVSNLIIQRNNELRLTP